MYFLVGNDIEYLKNQRTFKLIFSGDTTKFSYLIVENHNCVKLPTLICLECYVIMTLLVALLKFCRRIKYLI